MIKLSVSDPWDFEAPRGGNVLEGCILKRLDPKTLLFEAVEAVCLRGLTSRYWLLTARYEKQTFNAEPYLGTVNGALLPAVPVEGDSLDFIQKGSVFAIIGSLQA
jgi:hypothetical protein